MTTATTDGRPRSSAKHGPDDRKDRQADRVGDEQHLVRRRPEPDVRQRQDDGPGDHVEKVGVNDPKDEGGD